MLVMTSCSSVQSSSSKRPLSLKLPTPCLPSTPFREFVSSSALVLKSPRIITLSSARGALETATELRVELVFFYRLSLKSWRVHTNIPLIFQREAYGHHAVRMTNWQIFQPEGDRGADYETNASVVGFP